MSWQVLAVPAVLFLISTVSANTHAFSQSQRRATVTGGVVALVAMVVMALVWGK